MLQDVQGTDFDGLAHERAGVGTGVVFVDPDGGRDTVYILGEWDRDDVLAIISNQSRLALALAGAGPGDTVRVPGEDGPRDRVVEQVTGLSDAVREWITGGKKGA